MHDTDKTTTSSRIRNDDVIVIKSSEIDNFEKVYYLSNVRRDGFVLEVRYLLPGYHQFGDPSNYIVVTAFFDVRVRSSSYDDRNGRTRRGASAAAIAAWTVRDGFGQDKGKTELIEELGRATFVASYLRESGESGL